MSTRGPITTHGICIPAPCPGASLSVHSPGESLPWHEHDASYACLVLSGGFLESATASTDERQTGDVVLHPAGARHADRFGPDGAFCLNLRLQRLARPAVQRASASVRAAARALAAEAVLGPNGDRLEAESSLAEIVGELESSPRGHSPSTRRCERAPVDLVAQALDDHPHRPWRLVELAALADRHPTHLARAFRLVAGMSIGAYRRRNRLVALSLDLRCTSEPLGRLAMAHGYADQAHMTREFRRFAGCAPGAWRRRFR